MMEDSDLAAEESRDLEIIFQNLSSFHVALQRNCRRLIRENSHLRSLAASQESSPLQSKVKFRTMMFL